MPSKLTGSITSVSVSTYCYKKLSSLPDFHCSHSVFGLQTNRAEKRLSREHSPDSVHAEITQQGFIRLATSMPLSAPLKCDKFKPTLSELEPMTSLSTSPRSGLIKVISQFLNILLLKTVKCSAITKEQIIPSLPILFHNFNQAAGIARKKISVSSCLGCEENIKVAVLSPCVSLWHKALIVWSCSTLQTIQGATCLLLANFAADGLQLATFFHSRIQSVMFSVISIYSAFFL